MLVVAVAQVQPGRHVGRHTFDATNQPFQDVVEGLRLGGLEAALQDREFDGDVPLDGHVAGRNRRQQPVKIGEQCPLIRRFEPVLILPHDPTVDRRQRSRVLDLETDVRTGSLPHREVVGTSRTTPDTHRHTRDRATARHRARHRQRGVPWASARIPGRADPSPRLLQPRRLPELLELEEDPLLAGSRLAIGMRRTPAERVWRSHASPIRRRRG